MEGRAVGVAAVVLVGVLCAGLVPRGTVAAPPPACADRELTELRRASGREAALLACPDEVEALVRGLGGPAGTLAAPGRALVLDEAGELAPAAAGGGVALLLRRPLDVDRASAGDLALLPGIGPALAARIVGDRALHGAFGSPGGLVRVRGIGPSRVAALAGWARGPQPGEGAGNR